MQRLESASKGQDPWLTKQFESDPDLQKEVSRTLDLWCARVKYLLHTKAPTQASTPAFAWCMCRRRLAILLLTISCSLTRWHCQQIHDRKVVEEYCKIWLGVLEERRKEVEDAQVFSRPLYSSHRQISLPAARACLFSKEDEAYSNMSCMVLTACVVFAGYSQGWFQLSTADCC
jgi:hypothetical protein